MAEFQALSDISGIKMGKKKKASLSQTNIFLGIEGSIPTRKSGMQMTVKLPAEKAAKWSDLIRTCRTADAIERARLDKLIGRLSCAQSAIFARFARSLLGPLYRKLKSRAYTAELPHEERGLF